MPDKKAKDKKKPDKIVILSAIVGVVTLAIGVIFIYMPFSSKSKSLKVEVLHEKNRNLVIGKIRAIGKHMKVYNKRVPKNRGITWLLNKVSEMAKEQQIEVVSVKPGSPEGMAMYTKLYVTMDTYSSYDQLGKFISVVESSEQFLRVEDIKMQRLDVEEGFDKETSSFKPSDIKGYIVISAVILNEE